MSPLFKYNEMNVFSEDMCLGKNSYEFRECRARMRDGARRECTELSKPIENRVYSGFR